MYLYRCYKCSQYETLTNNNENWNSVDIERCKGLNSMHVIMLYYKNVMFAP